MHNYYLASICKATTVVSVVERQARCYNVSGRACTWRVAVGVQQEV